MGDEGEIIMSLEAVAIIAPILVTPKPGKDALALGGSASVNLSRTQNRTAAENGSR
jgi:hypothetical protein